MSHNAETTPDNDVSRQGIWNSDIQVDEAFIDDELDYIERQIARLDGDLAVAHSAGPINKSDPKRGHLQLVSWSQKR